MRRLVADLPLRLVLCHTLSIEAVKFCVESRLSVRWGVKMDCGGEVWRIARLNGGRKEGCSCSEMRWEKYTTNVD